MTNPPDAVPPRQASLTAGEPLARRPGAVPRRPTPDRAPDPTDPDRSLPVPPKHRDRPRRRQGSTIGTLLRVVSVLIGIVVAGGGIAAYGAWRHFSAGLPDVTGLRNYQPRVMSRVYSSDMRLMAELATERRIFVPYSAIPDLVKRAFVSAEDQNFFIHRGVDPVAITRAAVTNLLHYGDGRRPVGASTITQQVAKNILLGNEMSLSRKVREAILALRIEDSLSKDRILELYLNEIYLGLQAYGVAAAAESYFNKSLSELTLAETAFLAALPKAPNNYNPFRFPEAARARRDWVLDRMTEDKVITAEQAAAAKAQPIAPAAFRRLETLTGGEYFSEDVRRQLIDQVGADLTNQGGLVVHTSLDPGLQALADKTLRDGLMRYDQKGGWRGPVNRIAGGGDLRAGWAASLGNLARPAGMLADWRLGVVIEESAGEAKLGFLERPPGAPAQPRILPLQLADLTWARPVRNGTPGGTPRRLSDVVQPGDVVMIEPVAAAGGRPERVLLRQVPDVQGALVSIDPSTGRVLALTGGWSYELSQFDRATQAQRQPGSSFKPFVYLTALEQNILPSQRFLDAPFERDLGAAGKWRPNNYGLDFNGPIPLRFALEKSLNLVTVRVADRVGMDAVAQTAIGFHVVDNMPKVLPAALGAVETTVLRMAGAYAGLATGGREVVPTLIDSVQDRHGLTIWRARALECSGCDDPAQPPTLLDQRRQVVDPESVFQLTLMMQGVVQRGTGSAAGAGLGRAIAGKTGTTQDFNDAWFVGFTPNLVTAVWVGFDTPESLGEKETGGAISAPIFHDFMKEALKNLPNRKFVAPQGVTVASWDSSWGTREDAFKAGQEPGSSPLPVGSWGGGETSDGGSGGAGTPQAAGVDTGLGGLY